jgi:Zn-dependent protease
MKCSICDINESFPFKCNYCKSFFCHLHRLPPNHSCTNIGEYIAAKEIVNGVNHARSNVGVNNNNNNNNNIKLIQNAASTLKLSFSKTEIKHLSLATGLVTAVGLSFNHYRYISVEFLLIFISAFLVHELAHKFLAQSYGSWAEFRTDLYGIMVTAISAIPFIPFKFIAPGAVMIGLSDKSRFGRVALIGPLTNIVMGFSFILATYIFPNYLYLYSGASFNGWIALFNLLPFGVLDGQKIFDWNKIVWGITITLAMTLFIIGNLI